MEVYNKELKDLQEQMIRKRKLQKTLDSLNEQKKELVESERKLDVERDSEQSDVERLEGKSLVNYFYKVIGKHDEKLTKEREEAYMAAVKHDAVKTQLEAVEYDLKKAKKEFSLVRNCEFKYKRVLDQKKEEIKKRDPVNGEEILKLEEKINYIKNQEKEIDEAISAGNAALHQVRSIESSLDSAHGWSTWDLLGGGLVSDLAKHSHLDDAQSQVEHLQVLLRRFKTELADITIHTDIQIQIDGFLKFADFFFDGLFADWTVRNRISQSQSQVADTKNKIQMVLRKLNSMKSTAVSEQKTLKLKLDHLIYNA